MKTSVLIVVSSLAMGGPQKSLVALLHRLRPEKFDVELVVLNASLDDLGDSLPDWVRITRAPSLVRTATIPRGVSLLELAGLARALGTLPSLALLGEVAWQRMRGRPRTQIRQIVWRRSAPYLPRLDSVYDVAIGVLGLSTYAVVDLVAARRKYHWVRSDSRMLHRDEGIENSYFAQLDGAIAVSPQVRAVFEDMYPSLAGRVQVYKNDTVGSLFDDGGGAEWSSESRAVRVLTVARLDPLKGIDLAIEACSLLVSRGREIEWLVLGEGPERQALERLANERGLKDHFRLVGTVRDVNKYLREATVVVHPSRAEGRSNAVEEARAAEKAIVATCYPTVVDQVTDGVDGLVCGMNASSIALAIERVVDEPGLGERLGSCAGERHRRERGDPNVLFGSLARGLVEGSV